MEKIKIPSSLMLGQSDPIEWDRPESKVNYEQRYKNFFREVFPKIHRTKVKANNRKARLRKRML